MNADAPYWMEKDCYVLLDGEETAVSHFYRSIKDNRLVVYFYDGTKMDFDADRIKPLPAPEVPSWIQEGKAVELDDPHGEPDDYNDEDITILRVIERVWGRKRAGEIDATAMVKLVGLAPAGVDGLRPVEAGNTAKARILEDSYQSGLKKGPDFYGRGYGPRAPEPSF